MGHVLCIIPEIEESSMMRKGSPRTAAAPELLAVKNYLLSSNAKVEFTEDV